MKHVGQSEHALADHAFEHLFVECLGWDRARIQGVIVATNHSESQLRPIAQKRGFVVFVCPTHRTVLADRQLLRAMQRAIRKTYHEHIIIHYSETPKKQVWQWAIQMPDGRGIRHREHPFFSASPPPRLLERLNRLAVTWDEEENTTLVDVLARVRDVLLPDSELDLFAKWPAYAKKSDALAMAVKRREPGAFDEFVKLHMPLARKSSRMLIRWFEMTPDDAEQTAMIGLLEAARRFDPERGFQFSTYASYWIRQACQRYGLEWGFPLRLPTYAFWPCYRMQFIETELIATWGQQEARERLSIELKAAGIEPDQWERFRRARDLACFSDLDADDIRHLQARGSSEMAIDAAANAVLHDDLAKALETLLPRQAQILSLRFGIGQRMHTLQEVAEQLGITRERVRQIQVKAEERLQRELRKIGYSADAVDEG